MKNLTDFLGNRIIGVAAHYKHSDHGDDVESDVYICAVTVRHDNTLTLQFPKGHSLQEGTLLTLHLDNRTGVEEYDAELKVYRASYKGRVTSVDGDTCEVIPRECQLIYGLSVVFEIQEDGYQFPIDDRLPKPLPVTPLASLPDIDDKESDNKIGVLITAAKEQPHSAVMAFLSTKDDDVFFITFPQTFKSQLLKKHNHCYFAIDSRATFHFDSAIHWNYSIIKGQAYQVPKEHPAFYLIQNAFIEKNPFEIGFFTNPEVEMYHVKADSVICPAARRKI